MELQYFAKAIAVVIMIGYFLRIRPVFRDSFASRSWVETSAKVTASSVIKETKDWHEIVSYSYIYQGDKYDNNNLTFFGVDMFKCGSEKYMQNIVDEYPEGKDITIYVNPKKPQNSVVFPGCHWTQVIANILIGLVFIYFILFSQYTVREVIEICT